LSCSRGLKERKGRHKKRPRGAKGGEGLAASSRLKKHGLRRYSRSFIHGGGLRIDGQISSRQREGRKDPVITAGISKSGLEKKGEGKVLSVRCILKWRDLFPRKRTEDWGAKKKLIRWLEKKKELLQPEIKKRFVATKTGGVTGSLTLVGPSNRRGKRGTGSPTKPIRKKLGRGSLLSQS